MIVQFLESFIEVIIERIKSYIQQSSFGQLVGVVIHLTNIILLYIFLAVVLSIDS